VPQVRLDETIGNCFISPSNEIVFRAFCECLQHLVIAQFGILTPSEAVLTTSLKRTFGRCQQIFRLGRKANINYPNYFAGIAFAELADACGAGSMRSYWTDLLGGDPAIPSVDLEVQRRLNIVLFMGLAALGRCCRAYVLLEVANTLQQRQVLSNQTLTLGCPGFSATSCRQSLRAMVRASLGIGPVARR
jgi:hypothetical protein